MAYYYITDTHKVFKKVGARKVKMIYGWQSRREGMDGYVESSFRNTGIIYNPYIPLLIQSTPVVAQNRKLHAKWSIEMEQDLKMMHGIDLSGAYYILKNTIPFHKFKKMYNVILETKNYHDVIFEMAESKLAVEFHS